MTLTKWCRIFLKVTHISERPLRKKRTARLIKGQTPAAVVEKVQRIKNTSVIKIWSQWFVTIRLITHLVFHYKKVHRQASQLFLHPINRPSKADFSRRRRASKNEGNSLCGESKTTKGLPKYCTATPCLRIISRLQALSTLAKCQ